jgi:hypothetical protein
MYRGVCVKIGGEILFLPYEHIIAWIWRKVKFLFVEMKILFRGLKILFRGTKKPGTALLSLTGGQKTKTIPRRRTKKFLKNI